MEGEAAMALTRAFKELMRKRVAADPAFRDALRREGTHIKPAGTIDTGKATACQSALNSFH